MKNSEKLYKAAEYIMAHGHCKYNLKDSTGQVCVLGAIQRCGEESVVYCMENDDRALIGAAMAAAIIAIDPEPLFAANCWLSADVSAPDYRKAARYGKDGRGDKIAFVVDWNNANCRTGEDVILMLKTAAGFLEELESSR